VEDGGHARVEAGKSFGIVPKWFIHSCIKISSMVGRFEGSLLRILVIKSLAASEMATFSGKL
jgi:hypothetical protein